jgi:hypothetical protein
MMMSKRLRMLLLVVLVVGLVAAVVVAGMRYWKAPAPKEDTQESFAYDGALTGVNLGGNPVNTYNLVEPTLNTFADIVAPATPNAGSTSRNAECSRLPLATKAGNVMDTRDLLPDVNTNAVSYDVDVADPEVFMWRPSVRTAIHNRQHETADPFRGDLPITKSGCGYSNNGWFSSRYNEGDAKLDAYFSPYGTEKFRSLLGQRSYPMQVVNEGTIMDYQAKGKPDELVMDWY